MTRFISLLAALALSACATASRFVPGSTSEVPLDMALQAVKEERSIVYTAVEDENCPAAILLVEKNSGMTYKDSRLNVSPFNVGKNELLEVLRREASAGYGRGASEFRTPDGKRVAYAVPMYPMYPMYAMTVDTEKNEFTVSRIGCRRNLSGV